MTHNRKTQNNKQSEEKSQLRKKTSEVQINKERMTENQQTKESKYDRAWRWITRIARALSEVKRRECGYISNREGSGREGKGVERRWSVRVEEDVQGMW